MNLNLNVNVKILNRNQVEVYTNNMYRHVMDIDVMDTYQIHTMAWTFEIEDRKVISNDKEIFQNKSIKNSHEKRVSMRTLYCLNPLKYTFDGDASRLLRDSRKLR